MATIIGSIVNAQFGLIGYKVRGRASELGRSGAEKIEVRASIDELCKMRLKTNQVDFSTGRQRIPGSFKINSVKMEMFIGTGFKEIDNSMSATGRVVRNGKTVGFKVEAGGQSAMLPTEKIAIVADLMKPVNFVIRHSTDGKPFIAAKSGSIENLPVVADVTQQKATKKPVGQPVAKPAAPAAAPTVAPAPAAQAPVQQKVAPKTLDASRSFVTLLDDLKGCANRSLVVTFPNSKYDAVDKTAAPESFSDSNLGQYADPDVITTLSSCNLNLRFRKTGTVSIKLKGNDTPIQTTMFREKSVYRNGKPAVNNIGIALDKGDAARVYETYGAVLTEETGMENVRAHFAKVLNAAPDTISMYRVDLNKLPAFSNTDFNDARSTSYTMLALKLNAYDQVKSAYNACKKKYDMTIRSGGVAAAVQQGLVHKSLASYSVDELEEMEAAGIDLRYNTYTRVESGSSKSKSGDVEKELSLKWTVNLTQAAKDKKADDVADMMNEFETKMKVGNTDLLDDMKRTMNSIGYSLWLFNAKIMADAGFNGVKLDTDKDGKAATDTTSTRMKTSKRAEVSIQHPAIDSIVLEMKNSTNSTLTIA